MGLMGHDITVKCQVVCATIGRYGEQICNALIN